MRLTFTNLSYFKRYVQRHIAKASGVNLYKAITGWKFHGKQEWYYDEHRPWTEGARLANSPLKLKKNKMPLLEPISDKDWWMFKGDKVSMVLQ